MNVMTVSYVGADKLVKDPNNPRTNFSSAERSDLVASIKAYGIKVPLIGYVVANGVMIGDGHRRLDAGLEADLREFPVIVFPHKPSEAELLLTQLTVNAHRAQLNPVDEFEAFSRLAKLNNWSFSELAQGLAVSNSEVTSIMAIGKLSLDERQLVREEKISKSAAYALARMAPGQRAEMALKAASGEMTRDQLHSQVRRHKKGEEVKTQRVKCQVPGGSVSVQSDGGINLTRLIEVLDGLLRECRKLRKQKLTISSAVQVLNDQCRVPPAN